MRQLPYLIIFFLLIHLKQVYSQNNTINSIAEISSKKYYAAINRSIQSNNDSLSQYYSSLGKYYSRHLRFDSAYKYYDLSLKIANKTNNLRQIAHINNIIGNYYYDCENYDDARPYYETSFDLYKSINNPTGIASIANNLGELKRLSGKYEEALEYYSMAVEINETHQQYRNLCLNHNNIGLTYAHLKDYNNSLKHLQLAESIAKEHNYTRQLNNILNSIGSYYYILNQFDSSKHYLNEAYKESHKHNILVQIKENSRTLFQLHDRLGHTDSAYYFHKIFKTYSDSLLNNKNLMRMGLLVIQNKIENERRIERMQQNRIDLIYTITIISIISAFAIILLLWLNLRFKARHTRLKMEHLSLEKKYLNNELTNFALHISESNRFIDEIKKLLKEISVIKTVKNTEKINEIKLKLNTSITGTQNSKILEQTVDEHQREFIKLLKDKYPELTASELKLCVLLKLNLTTKEIAAINKVSLHAVKTARYRLRKKINLDSDAKFSEYFNTLL